MLTINIYSPQEVALQLAANAKRLRLAQNWSRKTLAARSGVSLGSIQRFEQTGAISLLNLLRLAQALAALEDFHNLLHGAEAQRAVDLIAQSTIRKRGRQ